MKNTETVGRDSPIVFNIPFGLDIRSDKDPYTDPARSNM